MRELPTPPSGPTPESISLATLGPWVRPSFLKQLETIVKTPFKTPGPGPSFQLPVSSPTLASVGTDTQETPEVSGSIRSADKGTETTSLAPRMTRSAAKQTPGSSPRPKRAYVSPSKGDDIESGTFVMDNIPSASINEHEFGNTDDLEDKVDTFLPIAQLLNANGRVNTPSILHRASLPTPEFPTLKQE